MDCPQTINRDKNLSPKKQKKPVKAACIQISDPLTWMMLLLEFLESVLTNTVKKGEVR